MNNIVLKTQDYRLQIRKFFFITIFSFCFIQANDSFCVDVFSCIQVDKKQTDFPSCYRTCLFSDNINDEEGRENVSQKSEWYIEWCFPEKEDNPISRICLEFDDKSLDERTKNYYLTSNTDIQIEESGHEKLPDSSKFSFKPKSFQGKIYLNKALTDKCSLTLANGSTVSFFEEFSKYSGDIVAHFITNYKPISSIRIRTGRLLSPNSYAGNASNKQVKGLLVASLLEGDNYLEKSGSVLPMIVFNDNSCCPATICNKGSEFNVIPLPLVDDKSELGSIVSGSCSGMLLKVEMLKKIQSDGFVSKPTECLVSQSTLPSRNISSVCSSAPTGVCPIEMWMEIKKKMEAEFPVEHIPLHQSYGEWARAIIWDIANSCCQDTLHHRFNHFCEDNDLSIHDLWILSSYDIKRAKESRYFSTNKSLQFDKGAVSPQADGNLAFAATQLESKAIDYGKKYKNAFAFLNKIIKDLVRYVGEIKTRDEQNIIAEINEVCRKLECPHFESIGDHLKIIIYNCATCVKLCPAIMSFCRMRVISSLDNHWLHTLHKLFIKAGMVAEERGGKWQLITQESISAGSDIRDTENELTDSAELKSFCDYVTYIESNIPVEFEGRQKLTCDLINGARESAERLDKLWEHTKTNLKELFFDKESFEGDELLDIPTSYVVIAAMHQMAKKAPQNDDELSQIYLNITKELNRIKSAVPKSYNLLPQHFPVDREYSNLIQAETQSASPLLQDLLENSTLSYVAGQIALIVRGLYTDFLSEAESGDSFGDCLISTIESTISKRGVGLDSNKFFVLLEHLLGIQQKMNEIYNAFSQMKEENEFDIPEQAKKLRQAECCFIKATQGKITSVHAGVNALRHLFDILSDASRSLDNSQDDSTNVFVAFEKLDIRENGDKDKDVSSSMNTKKLIGKGKLTYAWLFLKACLDGKKRAKYAENREEKHLPVDLQLKKGKSFVPFLAKYIVRTPGSFLEKSKDIVESLIWDRFQWPCDSQTGKLAGIHKPVSEWAEDEIKSFINTTGYLKFNKNYKHWWHLAREEKSNKGIETIPESNTMVVTPEIIDSIQFITEMVITYSIFKAERERSQHLGDQAIAEACSVLKSLLAENGEIKKRYNKVIDYRKNYHNKSMVEHKEIERSGCKLLEPSEIITIVMEKALLTQENKTKIKNIVNKSVQNGWLKISGNYFQDDSNFCLLNRLTLDKIDGAKSNGCEEFYHAYRCLERSWQEVLGCDYALSIVQHTDDELSYLIQGMSLPCISCGTTEVGDDGGFNLSNLCFSPVNQEQVESEENDTSKIIESELIEPFSPKLFELASKLFSDNIDSTGTHLAYFMLNGADSHAPHHLDQEVKAIQKSDALKKLNKFYKSYCKDMTDQNKRWKIIAELDKLLVGSQLSGWWSAIRNYARSGVEAMAKWDVWILPVYITWSLLTSKSLSSGGEVLDSVMDIRDLSAPTNNGTSVESVINALEECSRESSTSASSGSLVDYVKSMRANAEKIHKTAADMSSKHNNNFGATESGWYTANIVSSLLATVVGLVQSAGWFGDQLSIMEKTLSTENIGLITGMLPPQIAEHYLKMEVGECLYQPAFELCECKNKAAGQPGCPVECKLKYACRCNCSNDNGAFDGNICKSSCCDVINRCHDGLACIHTCPETTVHKCFGICCDLDKSPCARNISQATSYCCCCLCAGPGMLCAPLKAIIGNNPHNYRQVVRDRLDGASERTIGTATRTVPYNTFKEFLNTGDKRKTAILLGRVFALTVDGVIAVGEIAKFSCQANAFEKHESVSRALSKVYTTEARNEVDMDVLSKMYNSERAQYLLRGEKIVKIPFRSVDKALSAASWITGCAALAYSVSQVPSGIIGTCVKPFTAAFPTRPFKRLWNIVKGKESDDTWKGVMQHTLKTGINLSTRTIKEKVPAGASVYFLGKSQRLSSSRRTANMGNNAQAVLGNLKNGVTGPYNRTLLQSGDPAAMTFAGAIDAAEGFVVDAGNSERSARNMLNVPPSTRIAGRHLIESCWRQAMSCCDTPRKYTLLAKEIISMLSQDGVIQHSDFMTAFLKRSESLLQEDWLKLKSLNNGQSTESSGQEHFFGAGSEFESINLDSASDLTQRNARSKNGDDTSPDVTVTITETIKKPKLNHNPLSHMFHHAFISHQLKTRTNGILHPPVNTEIGDMISTVEASGSGADELEYRPPSVTIPFTSGHNNFDAIDNLVARAMALDLHKASAMSSLLPILIELLKHEADFMAYYSRLPVPMALSGCKSHQD
ncbi:MAG: hypothetical protein QS721_07980 [Candidatus Endonucleobacter sp. (ex Gigantidas childressi)]|nr:hypothetical protein [Candidatus Endonucleobacter sp. (ex Gigantidas childressi)]